MEEIISGNLRLFLAPMEGITGYLYRNAHRQYFPGIERYYTPFLAPHRNRSLKGKELRDVLPENNRGIPLVPQILTNQAEDFIRTAKELQAMGYEEVNLNLGCPSGTVVSKHKGAGFLVDPVLLDEFLSEIYEKSGVEISIKTRIGIYETEEFHDRLLSDYTQALSGDKPVLFKMKELWSYMLPLFEEEEKYARSIRKAERPGDYKAAVERLFTASLRPL